MSEYLNDDSPQTYYRDSNEVSIMETPKTTELNKDFSSGEHKQDVSSSNIDYTISTTNATIGSALQLDDESFKYSDDFKNDILEGSLIDKFGQYEDGKLNDSVSTTDAVLGSEPNTPMRMNNQSTFESENDDDEFSESFKQQLQLNQFDEHNDKKNHEAYHFADDPAGIIPNVTQEANKIDYTHQESGKLNDGISNDNQASKLINHEPVEEPLCVKEEAKPFHSVYEQQDLPESDFSTSTHEALLNATECKFNQLDDSNNSKISDFVEQKNYVESHVENEEGTIESQQQKPFVPIHAAGDVELDDSDVDEIKDHVGGLKQEFFQDDLNNFVPDINNHNVDLNPGYHLNDATFQNNIKEFEPEYHNIVSKSVTNNTENAEQIPQLCKEAVQNHVEDIVETVQSQVEDFEQECHNVLQVENSVDDLKLDGDSKAKNNHLKDFKQEPDNLTGSSVSYNADLLQEHHDTESIQNQLADSDEEMHSSMIIHADVENNMPQPYCSAHETLGNEPGMMSTSMTFEENFQNRNMNDSLYVMETSSDYFGEEIQQSKPLDNVVDEPKVEDPIPNTENILVEPHTQNTNEIVPEETSVLVSDSNVEVKAESNQLVSGSLVDRVDEPEENNTVSFLSFNLF